MKVGRRKAGRDYAVRIAITAANCPGDKALAPEPTETSIRMKHIKSTRDYRHVWKCYVERVFNSGAIGIRERGSSNSGC